MTEPERKPERPPMHAQYVPGCIVCDQERAAGNVFFPRHFASDRCESGKRHHCTCDVCF